jgi:hypothetical protein
VCRRDEDEDAVLAEYKGGFVGPDVGVYHVVQLGWEAEEVAGSVVVVGLYCGCNFAGGVRFAAPLRSMLEGLITFAVAEGHGVGHFASNLSSCRGKWLWESDV